MSTIFKVNVWGPPDLKYLVDAMRSFIPNAAMVHTRTFGPSRVLVEHDVVKISAILLQPSFSEISRRLHEASRKGNASEKVLEERMDNASVPSSPNSKIASGGKPGDMSVVYVCELSEFKGKFDPKKAAALGLRPGPKYRQLQDGQSVKSDNQDITVSSGNIMKLFVA